LTVSFGLGTLRVPVFFTVTFGAQPHLSLWHALSDSGFSAFDRKLNPGSRGIGPYGSGFRPVL